MEKRWLHKIVYKILPVTEPRGHHPTNKQLPNIGQSHSLPTKKKKTGQECTCRSVFNNTGCQLRLDRVNGSRKRRCCCTLGEECCKFNNNNAAAAACSSHSLLARVSTVEAHEMSRHQSSRVAALEFTAIFKRSKISTSLSKKSADRRTGETQW